MPNKISVTDEKTRFAEELYRVLFACCDVGSIAHQSLDSSFGRDGEVSKTDQQLHVQIEMCWELLR